MLTDDRMHAVKVNNKSLLQTMRQGFIVSSATQTISVLRMKHIQVKV